MKRLLFALPLLAAAACSAGSGPTSTDSSGRSLATPPPAPDVTPIAGPDAKQLAVVVARPQGELQGTDRPTLTFNKPVVALAAIEEDAASQGPAKGFTLEPKAAGKWHWLGSASVEFIPAAPLPYATEFTVSVPAGIAALDGTKLPEPYAFKFTTPAPDVQGWLSGNGDACRFAEPQQLFKVTLNQPVAEADKHFWFDSEGKRVAAAVVRAVNLQDEKREEEAKETDPAKKRRFARASSEELGFKNQQTRYELQPAQPLPRAKAFTLRLDDETRSAQGPLTLKSPWKLACTTYGAMKAVKLQRCWEGTEHCAYGPIWIEFTNPLGAVAELKKRLTITPAVTLDWDDTDEDQGAEVADSRTRVRIPGRWRSGQSYSFALAAGVKDKFGQEAPAFEGSVALDNLRPSLYLGREQALLEAAGDGQLPAQLTNVKSLSADLWVLTPQQWAQLRYCENRRDCTQYPSSAPDAQLKPSIEYPKNEARLYGIDLRAALKGAKTGLLAVRLSAPETPSAERPLRILAQITDVVVHAKVGVAGGVAWVTSAQTGTPAAGAKVAVFNQAGTLAAEAVTDADGVATLPPIGALDQRKPGHEWEPPKVLVAATVGSDTGVVTTAWDDQLRGEEIGAAFDVMVPRPLGRIITDRGIYRPGDTVHAKAVMRIHAPQQPTGLSIPTGALKFEFSVSGEVITTKSVPISTYGTAAIDLVVPKGGRLGNYEIVATATGMTPQHKWYGNFPVAEYRAPQFRVDVLAAEKEATAGSKLSATVSARYLFGGAMTGASARWSATRATSEFTPPKHDGYSFGRQTWGQDEGEPPLDTGLFATGKGTIDSKGNLAIDAGAADALGDRPTNYTVESEVQDVSRQTVAGRVSVLIHPASFYIGLGKKSLFTDAGKPFSVPVVAVRPDGGEQAGVSVKVTALQRSWHSVKKKGTGGVYQSVTEPVDEVQGSCDVKTGSGPVDCTLNLESAGYYTLRAEAKDEGGHSALSTTGVYALGKGFAAWQRSDSPKVELVADKTEYSVGEIAHVLIKSPYPECQALISIEREGVLEKRVQKLVGSATAIDVPITEAMVPNVYVGAVLQRARVEQGGIEPGDDPGRPSVRAGVADLQVGRQIKRLAVAINVPKPDWKPREKVPVTLSITDASGKPRRAEVALWAVDEAVLRLTAYEVPDLINEMFPHRTLGVALGEPLLSLVRRQKFGEKGEIQPGGGGGSGPSGNARNKFVTTALWTTVETGDDGKGAATLELPDNLTTFRIMALALTSDDRFGSAQSEVRVSLPLLVLPALPRFARSGDLFEAGVVVNAKGLSAQQSEVKVSAELSGAVQLAPGQPAEQTITAQEGVAREVRFKLAANGNGVAKLIFRASAEGDPGKGGPFKDAVEQSIPVQLPADLESVAVYGDTADQSVEGLVAPDKVQPGLGGLTLTLSSSALGGLGEGMRQLIDYPYGCLEQLSSRLVPFVALREVQKVFGVAAVTNEDKAKRSAELDGLLRQLTGRDEAAPPINPDEVVAQTVSRIQQLQTPSGGFRYWPGEGCTYAWPSIYATLALYRAKEAGYPVQKSVLDSARRFLVSKAEGQAACPYESVGPETRAFALQVLARMGDGRPAIADQLYEQKDQLPLFGKALLADAIAIGKGKRPKAQALLQDLLDAAQETPGEVHFAEKNAATYAPLFSSDVRTTGMVLQTLVDLQPGHPFVGKISRYFLSARHGGAFRNTQEAAYALLGLTEVVRVRERTPPDFTAKVTLGAKELATQKFQGRSLSVITKQVSIAEVTQASKEGGKKGAKFAFAVEGQGRLTYGALLRYAPAELQTKAHDEGMFVQRWLEPYEQSGKLATEFAAGELVRVRVRVATRMERHFVAVEVPLPAGLEAVDTQLAITGKLPQERGEESPEGEGGEGGAGEEGYDDQGQGAYGFWSPFVYSEKRDDRVVYFADDLPPGVHVQSFVARATTPGKFLLKPARAEEMYTPEVFGRSDGGTVTVVAQHPVTQR